MTITVYWTPYKHISGYRFNKPEYVAETFYKNKDMVACNYHRCPAVKDQLTNLFVARSPYDYTLDFIDEKQEVSSADFDQAFYDRMIHVRSYSDRLISFMVSYLFFTEEDSLTMEQLPPFLEDSNFANSTVVIPGIFDIGKWPRCTELAFHVKKHVGNQLKIKMNEPLFYLKFNTSEKIKFKMFDPSKKALEIFDNVLDAKKYKEGTCPINFYYGLFARYKYKKVLLREIKQNLME